MSGVDLSTTYLGFRLPHPLMPGASPLVDDLDTVRRLEDAGAAAIVMHSLFEEQIVAEQLGALRQLDAHAFASAEAETYFPASDVFALGPQEYLEQIRRIRETVRVPVIASLNGATPGGWIEYARLMEQAGAQALELNLYLLATRSDRDAAAVEGAACEIVRAVTGSVAIPVAVKLSPFFTALPHFLGRLQACGAAGAVLFNRFYQPDIDVENLEVERTLRLSDPSELLLRVHWLAICSGHTGLSLAASGGVHDAVGAVKAIMAGAHGVQLVSALLRHGPGQLKVVLEGLARWLEEHEYESLEQLRGSMNLERCPDPLAYERANYIQLLQGWHAPAGGGALDRRFYGEQLGRTR